MLDEATSHLDVERERAVNQALRATHMTRIVIAHRREENTACASDSAYTQARPTVERQ
jgi:ATP-binding cassette subfamily B protein RaxB